MESSQDIQQPPIREDVVRELEQYSVKVLEAVVEILQLQESRKQQQ